MTCPATRQSLNPDRPRICGKKSWHGSEFCYQHAISLGDAFVVRPVDVAAAIHRFYCVPDLPVHPELQHAVDETLLAKIILKAASA